MSKTLTPQPPQTHFGKKFQQQAKALLGYDGQADVIVDTKSKNGNYFRVLKPKPYFGSVINVITGEKVLFNQNEVITVGSSHELPTGKTYFQYQQGIAFKVWRPKDIGRVVLTTRMWFDATNQNFRGNKIGKMIHEMPKSNFNGEFIVTQCGDSYIIDCTIKTNEKPKTFFLSHPSLWLYETPGSRSDNSGFTLSKPLNYTDAKKIIDEGGAVWYDHPRTRTIFASKEWFVCDLFTSQEFDVKTKYGKVVERAKTKLRSLRHQIFYLKDYKKKADIYFQGKLVMTWDEVLERFVTPEIEEEWNGRIQDVQHPSFDDIPEIFQMFFAIVHPSKRQDLFDEYMNYFESMEKFTLELYAIYNHYSPAPSTECPDGRMIDRILRFLENQGEITVQSIREYLNEKEWGESLYHHFNPKMDPSYVHPEDHSEDHSECSSQMHRSIDQMLPASLLNSQSEIPENQ